MALMTPAVPQAVVFSSTPGGRLEPDWTVPSVPEIIALTYGLPTRFINYLP